MFQDAFDNNSSESNKRLFCELTTTQDEYICTYKYDDSYNVYIYIYIYIYQLKMLTSIYMS